MQDHSLACGYIYTSKTQSQIKCESEFDPLEMTSTSIRRAWFFVCCPHLGPPQTRWFGYYPFKDRGFRVSRNTHCSPVGRGAIEFTTWALIQICGKNPWRVSVIRIIRRFISKMKFTLFVWLCVMWIISSQISYWCRRDKVSDWCLIIIAELYLLQILSTMNLHIYTINHTQNLGP